MRRFSRGLRVVRAIDRTAESGSGSCGCSFCVVARKSRSPSGFSDIFTTPCLHLRGLLPFFVVSRGLLSELRKKKTVLVSLRGKLKFQFIDVGDIYGETELSFDDLSPASHEQGDCSSVDYHRAVLTIIARSLIAVVNRGTWSRTRATVTKSVVARTIAIIRHDCCFTTNFSAWLEPTMKNANPDSATKQFRAARSAGGWIGGSEVALTQIEQTADSKFPASRSFSPSVSFVHAHERFRVKVGIV